MALRLVIDNQQADLGKIQGITLKLLSDFFNLEVVEATVSLPFDLPDTPNNRRIFGHVNIPASIQPMAEELPAVLEADGALIRKGVFVLDRYRKGFEGYFKADAGVFSPIKDSLISEFIPDTIHLDNPDNVEVLRNPSEQWDFESMGEVEAFFYMPGDYDTREAYYQKARNYYAPLFDGRFDSIDSNICFPLIWDSEMARGMTGRNSMRVNYVNNPIDIVESKATNPNTTRPANSVDRLFYDIAYLRTKFRPCIKLHYILRRIFESQGYQVELDFESEAFRRACFICGKTSFFPMVIAELMPKMTVKEFVNSLRATFGLAFSISSSNQKVTVSQMKTVLADTESTDWTEYLSPEAEVEAIKAQEESHFRFGHKKEDGEGERFPSIPSTHSIEDNGKLYLNRATNGYVKLEYYKDDGSSQALRWLMRPGALVNTEEPSGKLVSNAVSKFVPVPNQNIFVERWEDADVNIPDLTHIWTSNLKNTGIDFRVRILDSIKYADAFYPTEVNDNPYSDTIKVQGLAGNGRETKPIEYLFSLENPSGSGDLNIPSVTPALDGQPMLTMWHGIQNGYRYASSGNLSPNGMSFLLNTALRWETAEGLADRLFEEFEQVSQDRKSFTFTGYLPLAKALNFQPLSKIMVQHVKYLVTKLELKLRNDRRNGMVGVEVRGRRV